MTFVKHACLWRSARSGGSLGLRTTLLLLLGLSLLSNLGNPTTVWAQPVPNASFNQTLIPPDVPSEVLIGETFKFKVRFKNTGTIGFGPFIDLAIDSRGADNNTAAGPCDGIDFVSAEMVAVNPGPLPLTSTKNPAGWNAANAATNCANFTSTPTHPYAGVGTVILPNNGWQLVTIELPFGNYGPTQPEEIVVEVTAKVHSFADMNYPLRIYTRGGFRLTSAASGPPILEHGNDVINDNWAWVEVTPRVFKIKKEYIGPEDETATGPNFIRKYKITLDIADGQTIGKPLTITDCLPNNMAYEGGLVVAPPGPYVQTKEPPKDSVNPQPVSCLVVSWINVAAVGVSGPDATVEFQFSIRDKDADGNELLQDCEPVLIANGLTVTGGWSPKDPRDLGGTVTGSNPNAHTLSDKCMAIQKKVTVVTPTVNPNYNPIPGDTLEYTLDFQISDYKTIGIIKVEDHLSDGQLFIPGSAMLTVGDQLVGATAPVLFPAGTVSVTSKDTNFVCKEPPATPQIQGGTKIIFDVSGAMAALGLPPARPGILTGGYAAPPTTSTTPATGRIVFRAQIQDAYDLPNKPSPDLFIDKYDPLTNCVEIRGTVFKNEPPVTKPTPTIVQASDQSSADIIIVPDKLAKSVYAVKRGSIFICQGNCLLAPEVRPGDQVTFRIEYPIPSSDAENLKIQDWLPLPVFDVSDPDGNGTAGPAWNVGLIPTCSTPPPWGNACRFIPAAGTDTLGPPFLTGFPTLVVGPPQIATNSILIDYGPPFNDPGNAPRKIDLLFTITVTHKPFADGLYLTNEAQECEDNTFGVKFCQTAIAQVNVREPKLSIKKGVVATDNPHGQFGVYDPSTHTFTPGSPPVPTPSTPPSSCPRVPLSNTAPITSANLGSFINSDLNSVDAGDWVTFAIAIENTGGAPAYEIELADIIPLGPTDILSCFEPNFNGLCVTYGNGATIPFTTASGGHARIKIKLGLPLAAGSPSNPTGTNIAIITFNAKLLDKDKLKAGCCENKAELIYYGSTPPTPTDPPNGSVPPPNFVDAGIGGPFEDNAWVCVKAKPYAKCIQTTSEAHTPGTPSGPPLSPEQVAIGEIVRYRLITVIPEGTTLNFQIKDLLPQGLTYVGNPKAIFVANNPVTNPLGIPTVKPPHGGVQCPGGPPPTAPISVSPSSFPFGTGTDPNFPASPISITNNDPNHPDLEFLIIEFNAQVDNILGNQDTTAPLPNTFQVHYKDEAGNSFSSTSGPVNVHIVEPKLTLTKTVSPTTVTQGATVTYTVTITNTGTTAFDVNFNDTLPPGLTFDTGSVSVAGPCLPFPGVSLGAPSVSCDRVPIGVVTIKYQAVANPPTCPVTLTNQAKVTWTSLPGPQGTMVNPTGSSTVGPSGANNGERNGVTPPLTLNDYAANASATLTVTCPKDCVQPPSGMVSWWPMDDQTGAPNVIDIWDGNNGTALNAAGVPTAIGAGGPASILGQYVGNSLYFAGSYVKVSNTNTSSTTGNLNFGTTGNFSIDAWVHLVKNPNQTTVPIVSKYAATTGYAFYLQNGNLMLALGNNIFGSGAVITATGWYHIAVTVNRATATGTFYLNGAPAGPGFAPSPGLSATSTVDLWIGKNHPPLPQDIEFGLDEPEIFNRALTAQEVKDIADAKEKGKCKSDLGDAPDSTNHFGTAMDAYTSPSVPANFPTVYDPNLAGNAPLGPIHLNAKGDAWLGRDVTFEGEADKGWDQDGVGNNNIQPASNIANRDDKDDGVILSTINLPAVGCGNMQFQYTVTVVGPQKPRYVNVWFDFNQDGDWQDVIPCSGTALVAWEWAVQNQTFNVGAGFYTFTTPVFVGFRPTIGPPGMWMRITLTDTPVASTQGADGSGPVGGYKFGETEDYLLDVKPGKKAEICVTKFHDLDGDGVQDPGEPGLPGWTFTVTPGGPTIITGPQGTICFGVPAPATYTVSEVLQAGWTPTAPPTGSQTVTVSAGLVNLSFGNKKGVPSGKAEICVTKFHDLDGDGVQDPGEPGLPGWTFTVTPGGPTIITGSQGTVCFGVPAPATYTISEVPQLGWIPTAPPSGAYTVTVQPGLVNLSFGNNKKDDDKKCDLKIEKFTDPSPPVAGQPFAFVVRVTNVGGAPCPPTTIVMDTLPSGFTPTLFNPNTAGGWSCPSGPPNITCANPTLTLQPTQSSTVFVVVGTATPGIPPIRNCAGVKNPNDPNPANNEVCIGVPVAPPVGKCDLAIRKSVSPNPATSGQPVTIALTVTNVGTGPCGPDTVVQDPRPAGLTFTAAPVANQPGWACSLPGGNASCVTAGTLPPGYTATFTFTGPVTAPPGSTITNCATVSNRADTTPASNQSCATIQVQRGVGPPPRPLGR